MLFKKISTPIVWAIIAIVALVFSLIFFPTFMGGLAVVCVLGSIIFLIGMIINIIAIYKKGNFEKGARIVSTTGATAFVLCLIIFGSIALASSMAQAYPNTVGGSKVTVAQETTEEEPEETTTTEPEATPVATATTTTYSSGQAETTDTNTVHLFVLNPEAPSQAQIQHPSVYVETHVTGIPVTMNFDVPEGYVGIVGGFTVDKTSDGYYQAFGPGNYTFVVTDGFGLITTKEWGQEEWDFRIGQCVQYNWAHSHEDPGPLKDN